jgi:hypothetical protein
LGYSTAARDAHLAFGYSTAVHDARPALGYSTTVHGGDHTNDSTDGREHHTHGSTADHCHDTAYRHGVATNGHSATADKYHATTAPYLAATNKYHAAAYPTATATDGHRTAANERGKTLSNTLTDLVTLPLCTENGPTMLMLFC